MKKVFSIFVIILSLIAVLLSGCTSEKDVAEKSPKYSHEGLTFDYPALYKNLNIPAGGEHWKEIFAVKNESTNTSIFLRKYDNAKSINTSSVIEMEKIIMNHMNDGDMLSEKQSVVNDIQMNRYVGQYKDKTGKKNLKIIGVLFKNPKGNIIYNLEFVTYVNNYDSMELLADNVIKSVRFK